MSDSNDKPLGRYIRVLETVAAARTGLTLTDIARELDLQPGTAHRLIRGSQPRPAAQCARAQELRDRAAPADPAHATMDRAGYAGLAKSVLDGLVARVRRDRPLARLSGDFASPADGAAGGSIAPSCARRQLPLHARIRQGDPAFQDEAFVARYLSHRASALHGQAKVEDADIRNELAQIREDGVAVCDNELDAGVLSYGHPIRVNGGYVLYSVGITGLADRFRPMERSRIKQKLAEAAADLGKRLGFTA